MNRVKLIYRTDPKTGLPKLEDESGTLDSVDVHRIQQEIQLRYDQILTSQQRVIALENSGQSRLPRLYRVDVEDKKTRCPKLILQALSRDEIKELEELARLFIGIDVLDQVSWPVQFCNELTDLLDQPNGPANRSALDFVLADLRAVWRKNPKSFTLMLLTGYLYAGDAFCRAYGETNNKYVQAAHQLNDIAGDALPPGVLLVLLSGDSESE